MSITLGVTDIDADFWRDFQSMNHVNLIGNKLQHIPEIVRSFDYSNVNLDIRDNHISCDCKSQWLKSWLNSLNGSSQNANGVNCYAPYWLNGKSILSLDEGEFCRGPPYTMKAILEITIPSISVVILLNLFAAFLLRRFRIQIYKYVKLHPFDRDECNGEDIDYDVFMVVCK